MKRACAYIRRSKEQVAKHVGEDKIADSIQVQIALIRQAADKAGDTIHEDDIYVDDDMSGASVTTTHNGTKVKIPRGIALDRLLGNIKAYKTVYVWKFDRLARDQEGTQYLSGLIIANKARLVSAVEGPVEDTPIGKFLANTYAFVAEIERQNINLRCNGTLNNIRRSGKIPPVGKPRYGYRWVKEEYRREIDPETAPVVEQIFKWAAERVGVREIGRRLNAKGIPGPRGGAWLPRAVSQILHCGDYKGDPYVWGRKRSTGEYKMTSGGRKELIMEEVPEAEWTVVCETPHIVTEELWRAANEALAAGPKFRGRPAKYPGSWVRQFVRCGHCGSMFSNSPNAHKNYYSCNGQKNRLGEHRCHNKRYAVDVLERLVWEKVRQALDNPKLLQERVLEELNRGDGESLAEAHKHVQAELAKVRKALTRAVKMELEAQSEIESEVITEQKGEYVKRIVALEANLTALDAQIEARAKKQEVLKGVKDLLEANRAYLDNASEADKAKVCESLGLEVRLWADLDQVFKTPGPFKDRLRTAKMLTMKMPSGSPFECVESAVAHDDGLSLGLHLWPEPVRWKNPKVVGLLLNLGNWTTPPSSSTSEMSSSPTPGTPRRAPGRPRRSGWTTPSSRRATGC
jgi:DNA invertase Pin-like site-specific DNA recombinase